MSIVTNHPAATIHKQFKLFGDIEDFDDSYADKTEYIDADLVVMDESSMTDMNIFYQVLSKIKPTAKLILVGDPNQLPSVQPGNVLNELLKLAPLIPSMHLTKVYRQKDGSCIAENADRIQRGETELIYDSSFMFVPAENSTTTSEIICKLYLKASKLVGRENVQVLSPMRKKGECGINRLNRVLQAFTHRENENIVSNTRHRFQAGDLVIQNKNKDGINNGDMGEVIKVNSNSVIVKFFEFETPIVKTYKLDSLKRIELAYALTVHKSQGSEYPIIILPVISKQKFMLTRNLFYTAITRGAVRVVLVGQKEAIEYAIDHEDTSKRNTMLAKRIRYHYETMKRMMLCENQEDMLKSA